MARLRVRVGRNELELEGAGDWIRAKLAQIEDLIGLLKGGHTGLPDVRKPAMSREQLPHPPFPASFDQWISAMPPNPDDRTKLLWVGLFVQLHARDRTFRVSDLTRLLDGHRLAIDRLPEVLQTAVRNRDVMRLDRGRYRVSNGVCLEIQTHLRR